MLESPMRPFLRVSLASLLACVTALAATDVSGRWASAPVYLILKQEGNKLSGTGGPTEKEQMVTFDDGTVEGDRVTFHVGTFQFNLQLNGDEMRGEMKNGADSNPVFLKRVTDRPSGPRTFEVASVKRSSPPPGNGINSSMRLDPGRLTCTNVSLKKLIFESYGVKDYQVSGPDWLGTEIYDITATVPPGTTRDDVPADDPEPCSPIASSSPFTATRGKCPCTPWWWEKAAPNFRRSEFARGSTPASPGKSHRHHDPHPQPDRIPFAPNRPACAGHDRSQGIL